MIASFPVLQPPARLSRETAAPPKTRLAASMPEGEPLVLHPTRAEFSQPFLKYVSDVLAAHPDVAVFKVVPPRGWSPRQAAYPPLEDVTIGVPIKQHVRAPVQD